MLSKDKAPLGYVELPSGPKAIYPMNDIFLNYVFESPAHWEALRLVVNILIDAYRQINPETPLMPIEGSIEVKTQYRHLLPDGKVTRDQDIKMTDDKGKTTYIEFQNKAMTSPPVSVRSVEYFGLGIGHSKGKTANQIWLLAEDIKNLLYDEPFARYILKHEVTGCAHPETSGIMYISLGKLSQEENTAGELACFLLGRPVSPANASVKNVVAAIEAGFSNFKLDKDVVNVLSFQDRWLDEGRVEGRVEGIARLAELIRNGLSLDEALKVVEEETTA